MQQPFCSAHHSHSGCRSLTDEQPCGGRQLAIFLPCADCYSYRTTNRHPHHTANCDRHFSTSSFRR